MLFAVKYRAARRAKRALCGAGDWEKIWRDLADADLRTMLAEDDPVNATLDQERQLLSEGRRVTSWIWMGADQAATDGIIQESMQDGTSLSSLYAQRANAFEQRCASSICERGHVQ